MRLGITLGDCTGIGPEVALKAVARVIGDDETTQYVLIGDGGVAAEMAGLLGVEAALPEWGNRDETPSRLYVDEVSERLPQGLAPGDPLAAEAAVAALRRGGQLCLASELQGLVTAPVNKESILRLGRSFTGQTEYLAELAGCSRFAMMLLGADDRERWLRVLLVTTHLPLREVPTSVTPEAVAQTIELAAEAAGLLGLARQRIGVCGLNPHAGEGGMLGREDLEIISPAVRAARLRGLDVHGPIAADTLFSRAHRGDFEVVVAMYHDQGLGPLKLVAFENGVNWTVGLPFVRTSPDHGTAYDLAGQGRANEASMVAAIRLARTLAQTRP